MERWTSSGEVRQLQTLTRIARLPRQAGQKEVRFAQLLSGDIKLEPQVESETRPAVAERVTLEKRVALLEEEVERLRLQLEEFKRQFD